MLILIDNYDSFSYNLYQMLGAIRPDIRVIRNDEMRAEEIVALRPEAVVISPGPGRPEDAGVSMDVIRLLGETVPILGVCLGHQAICAVYGMRVTYAKTLMHGKQSTAKLDTTCPLFHGLHTFVPVARYHSLSADEQTLPEELLVTARSEDGEIMAVMHKDFPVYGVQFHPESILTPDGKTICTNFLEGTR